MTAGIFAGIAREFACLVLTDFIFCTGMAAFAAVLGIRVQIDACAVAHGFASGTRHGACAVAARLAGFAGFAAFAAVLFIAAEIRAARFACGEPVITDITAFAVITGLVATGVAAFPAIVDIRLQVIATVAAQLFACRTCDSLAFTLDTGFAFAAFGRAGLDIRVGGAAGIDAFPILTYFAVCTFGITVAWCRRYGSFGNAFVVFAFLVCGALRVSAKHLVLGRLFIRTG